MRTSKDNQKEYWQEATDEGRESVLSDSHRSPCVIQDSGNDIEVIRKNLEARTNTELLEKFLGFKDATRSAMIKTPGPVKTMGPKKVSADALY